MKYAIVESGGKQYKAVEGSDIVVDRLILRATDESRHRLSEDIEAAAVRGAGLVIVD